MRWRRSPSCPCTPGPIVGPIAPRAHACVPGHRHALHSVCSLMPQFPPPPFCPHGGILGLVPPPAPIASPPPRTPSPISAPHSQDTPTAPFGLHGPILGSPHGCHSPGAPHPIPQTPHGRHPCGTPSLHPPPVLRTSLRPSFWWGGGTQRPPIPPYPIPRTPRSPPASTALIDTPWIPPPSPIPPKGTPWPPHLCPGPPQPHPGMPGSGCGCPWLSMARASLSHCRAWGGGLRGAPSLTHRRRQPLYSLGLQQGHVTPCPPPSAGAQQRLGGPGWESHMGGRGGTSVRGAQGDAGAPQGWEGGVGGWGGRAR